jgi:hypothetical protein
MEGVPIVDCHDCIFPEEGHRVASAPVFLEFSTPGEGPQGHEVLHHIAVLELVLDGLWVVRAVLLEESLKVLYWRPHLTLATVCGWRDTP